MPLNSHTPFVYAVLSDPLPDGGKSPVVPHLSATGRARIAPPGFTRHPDYAAAISACTAAHESDDRATTKSSMKAASSSAASLMKSYGVDVSVIVTEVGPVPLVDVASTGGRILTAFLDAAAAYVVLDGRYLASLPADASMEVDRARLVADFTPWEEAADGGGEPPTADEVAAASLLAGDVVLPSADLSPAPSDTHLIVRLQDPAPAVVAEISARGIQVLLGPAPPSAAVLAASLCSTFRTDRPDGLFTTVVCGRAHGEALGLVYSSADSVLAAIECGRGVYYSRSRGGLWRKGDTSGHYQILHKIDSDCDGDAVRFIVTQLGPEGKEPAFCHLETRNCWGKSLGLNYLESMLVSRKAAAPEGSYTKRLFDDPELLRDKLVEEAQELAEATEREDVAGELADVLYFAMTKAVAAGVPLSEAIEVLDKRARKVTRRPGNSKVERIEAGKAILERTKGAKISCCPSNVGKK
eukprot:CAMPEP_0194293078 /NCGR_PEP_ID=MMETSP0169-20130528/47074_1 /TAXON_ID=218684 /ORGANISM="Corethron pennatum, Strain L29A3" /LENGTH=468 /DNA_ID=CAMNT_0039041461 /DNA_START=26 /DNA_END=1432 /DNA_ORIENTATION=-